MRNISELTEAIYVYNCLLETWSFQRIKLFYIYSVPTLPHNRELLRIFLYFFFHFKKKACVCKFFYVSTKYETNAKKIQQIQRWLF